ncbi:MAG TPA: polyprenol monophosphomannose synthase [Pyrinomonadaceae bacterium]|jgi:dolichol-phosphate mannosyltransferase
MRAVVVVPTYNELANLTTLVEKLRQYAPELHILIVDDNSPDGTGQLADELSAADPKRIAVLHRQRKEGLGRAYVDGFKEVLKQDYQYILQMDADLSHDPVHLPDFFAKIKDHDLVVGSRYLKGISVVNWDLKRLAMSKLATNYVRFITRMPFTDATSGYSCWRRQALEAIDFQNAFSSGYVFLVELKYKAFRKGFRVGEVPIIFIERKSGNSKMDWAVVWEAFWGVLRLRLKQ